MKIATRIPNSNFETKIMNCEIRLKESHFQGIMLSIMLFLAGFVIYPIAAALGGGYKEEFATIRVASAIYTALQALVIITWAFYTAFHACCNSVSLSQTFT